MVDLGQNKILDYGCGSGLFLVDLSMKGADISGYDISKHNVDLCRKYCTENACNPDLFLKSLPLSEKWDTILLINVLEYAKDKEALILDVQGHLNKGGQIVVSISLPNHPFIRFNSIRTLFSGRGKDDVISAEATEKLDEIELLGLFSQPNFLLCKTKIGAFYINKYYIYSFLG